MRSRPPRASPVSSPNVVAACGVSQTIIPVADGLLMAAVVTAGIDVYYVACP